MNDKKFCFIICTNSQLFFDENMRYIKRLVIPDGYDVDILGITDAKSITEGYNEGMRASDAKYKIYMHQDVFILYPYFLQSVLDIFASNEQIGMIGLVGAQELPCDGIMWHSDRLGMLYEVCGEEYIESMDYSSYRYQLADGLWDVLAIDGLMMITSKDIPWREDILTGWDFYDVSQSLEMIRAGYKVVVPEQEHPWCLHDDGILNYRNYDKYRRICMQEYAEFFKTTDKKMTKLGMSDDCGQIKDIEQTDSGKVTDGHDLQLKGKNEIADTDTGRFKIEIIINTKMYKEHKRLSELFTSAFQNRNADVVVVDLKIDILNHEKIALIRKEQPHLLVTFDMAGFELRTTLDHATYSVIPCRMAHILWKRYEEYDNWLRDGMNFSMFLYGMERTVDKIYKKHPEIDNVKMIESCTISEWLDEPQSVQRLVDQIIADTEIEIDY